MKCSYCDKPAMYQYKNNIQLCLDHHATAENVRLQAEHQRLGEALLNAAMLNQSLDDMDAVAPFGLTGGRIPVAAIAAAASGKTTFNNISIKDASIGILNTGDLAKIDAVVTITAGTDAEELGKAIRDLTQAVIESDELAREAKHELGELIVALTEQITGKRSKPVLKSLMRDIAERSKSINAIWSLYEKVAGLISNLT